MTRLQLQCYVAAMICLSGIFNELKAQAPPPAANTVCPVMVGEEINKSLFVDYKGKRVYFCCTFCISKFKKNPEKYVVNMPAFSNTDALASSAPESAPDTLPEDTPAALTPEQALAADNRKHLSPFLQFLGKLHPIVVHFPIALILAALLAEILALTNSRWKPTCETSARFMLPLGALGATPAVLFGWFAADGAGKAGELGLLIYRHRWLGVITLGVALIAALLQYFATRYGKPKLNWLYKAALLLAAVLVGITGHLGGLIVYGLDRF